MVYMLLPVFNDFLGKELSLGLSNHTTIVPFIGFILLGTLLSGLYPAIVISGFSPLRALKGKIKVAEESWELEKY